MVDLNIAAEEQLNQALELLHFGFRAITSHPDERLAALGYSRVHHRILYFIGRHPGSSVNGLLQIMKVSKQYLHRPLKRLVEDGYVLARADNRDRRSKQLSLSAKGSRLEASLTGEQRKQLARAFEHAGEDAESGWRKVMALLAGEQ
ncbi:MarR family winged helix-turn-helix transcriptional regulator [Thiolapillus sp.]